MPRSLREWRGDYAYRTWSLAILGCLLIEFALALSRPHLAATERGGFKHTLILEGRLLIRLLALSFLLWRLSLVIARIIHKAVIVAPIE
jgi:hypothetical protein